MAVNYGSKRIVVGAHYGVRDWLSQRVTAALMALFTVVVLAQVIFSPAARPCRAKTRKQPAKNCF